MNYGSHLCLKAYDVEEASKYAEGNIELSELTEPIKPKAPPVIEPKEEPKERSRQSY